MDQNGHLMESSRLCGWYKPRFSSMIAMKPGSALQMISMVIMRRFSIHDWIWIS